MTGVYTTTSSFTITHARHLASKIAADVLPVLARLFAAHGAPLVLKADNGSAFIADLLKRFLRTHGVLALYSPPGTPSYNGACEAGIGGLKRVAEDLRIADDGGFAPLGAYLPRAAAILDAQPISRRSGARSRADEWHRRAPCPEAMRIELQARYEALERHRRFALGIAIDAPLSHAQQASLDRHAIREALCDMQLLVIRRP